MNRDTCKKYCLAAGLLLGTLALSSMSGCVVYATPPRHVVVGYGYYYGRHRGEVIVAPAPIVVGTAPPVVAVQPADLELQQLVAPIALYPDPLLAQLLPASTYPQQVQEAARWVRANPNPPDAAIQSQNWDPSVKAMVHYPTVLQYMSDNIGWTESLGSAVASEQAGVMEAVQDLRAQAKAEGNLHDTPEQVIVQEGPTLCIEPAVADVIYVPVYDPAVVYFAPCPVTFGVSFVAGPWLAFDFDWSSRFFFFGGWHDWHREWNHGPYGWHHDPHFFRPGIHGWAHDGRFGMAPHVEHFAYPHDFHHDSFHSVPYRGGGESHAGGESHGGGGDSHGGGGGHR